MVVLAVMSETTVAVTSDSVSPSSVLHQPVYAFLDITELARDFESIEIEELVITGEAADDTLVVMDDTSVLEDVLEAMGELDESLEVASAREAGEGEE